MEVFWFMTKTRTFYYRSQELWERFKEVTKAEGKSVSKVLGEFIDNYLIGYVDPTIPSLHTYFEPQPNTIEAVQRRICIMALKRAEKLGGDITYDELRDMYRPEIPTTDMRNAVVRRTAKWLKTKGVKVWQ